MRSDGGLSLESCRAATASCRRSASQAGFEERLVEAEHEDLTRPEAACARLTVSADERAYFDRRLADLEMRARVRR